MYNNMNPIFKKILFVITFVFIFSSIAYCIQPNKYYAALTAKVNSTGSGTVYVNGDNTVSADETCTNIKYQNNYREYDWNIREYVSATVNFTATAYPNPGYSFTKWEKDGSQVSTSSSYSANYVVSENKSTSSDTNAELYTITAFFSPISYQILFSANGGSGTGPSLIHYTIEDTDKTFPLCSYTYTGHKFVGWKPSSNVGNWTTSQTFQPGETITGKWGNVTLSAQWIDMPTVTISVSGLSSGDSAIFNLRRNNSSGDILYTVVLTSDNSSVTIQNLDMGVQYYVEPVSDWNWYTMDPTSDNYTLSTSTPTHTFEFTATKKTKKHDETFNVNWKP